MKPSRSPRFQSLAERVSAAVLSCWGSPVGTLGAAQAATSTTTPHTLRMSHLFVGGPPQRTLPDGRCNPARGSHRLRTGPLPPLGAESGDRSPAAALETVRARLSLLRWRIHHPTGRAGPLAVSRRSRPGAAARARAVGDAPRLDHAVGARRADAAPAVRRGRRPRARGAGRAR